ncbi:hypothetical protein FS749_008956 [Ceratobasidium sp. UAMH 11750]|nr:hypothetical protein FS749_008956 [Ceratobasidium sp. UAMH 11750]
MQPDPTPPAPSEKLEKGEEKIESITGTTFSALAPPIVQDDDELYPENFRGWLVVVGCFMLSSMTLGFGLCWGVFQEYYQHHILVGTPSSVLGLLGSTQGAVGTVSSLFFGKLGDR